MSKELEDKLAEAVALVESVKKEIEESKELKPYDWCNGIHFGHYWTTKTTFKFEKRGDVEKFDHKLKILSCINNLKKTLGCNHEFTSSKTNYMCLYDEVVGKWVKLSLSISLYTKGLHNNFGSIVFNNKQDTIKVIDYLNKHYPNGWSLPSSECD